MPGLDIDRYVCVRVYVSVSADGQPDCLRCADTANHCCAAGEGVDLLLIFRHACALHSQLLLVIKERYDQTVGDVHLFLGEIRGNEVCIHSYVCHFGSPLERSPLSR